MRHLSAALMAASALCSGVSAESATLIAVKDNSLIETLKGTLGNGAGDHFHCGITGEFSKRRGVVAFDLSSIPAGSTVTSVTLRLNMSMTGTFDSLPVSVHRVQTQWTEGTSDPPFGEGTGALATPGDATWLHSSYPRQFWNNTGGDFDAAPLATTAVAVPAAYTWSSAELTACVQGWVDAPSTNFGLLVHGVESTPMAVTSKRFDSHSNPNAANRPRLTVDYTLPPEPCTGDLDGSGAVDGIDLGILLVNWSLPPNRPACDGQDECPPDLDGSGFVNGIDLGIMLANWGDCSGPK